ncbi:transmembrane protein 143 [Falco naumanni]|uniref:transmembrane protein 143 n=1 Tax=Falco naumanni TaxID=148594 RepID=UPI001ADEB096|nr:transmembrane protein 143 [Falco naumanni]
MHPASHPLRAPPPCTLHRTRCMQHCTHSAPQPALRCTQSPWCCLPHCIISTPALYPVHPALHLLHLLLHPCSLCCTHCSLHCAPVHPAWHLLHPSAHSAPCIALQCALHSTCCSLHCTRCTHCNCCTLHSTHCSLHCTRCTLHCTQCTHYICCTLHSTHCSLHCTRYTCCTHSTRCTRTACCLRCGPCCVHTCVRQAGTHGCLVTPPITTRRVCHSMLRATREALALPVASPVASATSMASLVAAVTRARGRRHPEVPPGWEQQFRDSFIPLSREELQHVLLTEFHPSGPARAAFLAFTARLDQALHPRYHRLHLHLQALYGPIDPDRDTMAVGRVGGAPGGQRERRVVAALAPLLAEANFQRLPEAAIAFALLVQHPQDEVQVSVKLEEYEEIQFWALGQCVGPLPDTAPAPRRWRYGPPPRAPPKASRGGGAGGAGSVDLGLGVLDLGLGVPCLGVWVPSLWIWVWGCQGWGWGCQVCGFRAGGSGCAGFGSGGARFGSGGASFAPPHPGHRRFFRRVVLVARPRAGALELASFRAVPLDALELLLARGRVRTPGLTRARLHLGLAAWATFLFLNLGLGLMADLKVGATGLLLGLGAAVAFRGAKAFARRREVAALELARSRYRRGTAQHGELLAALSRRAQDEATKEALLAHTFLPRCRGPQAQAVMEAEAQAVAPAQAPVAVMAIGEAAEAAKAKVAVASMQSASALEAVSASLSPVEARLQAEVEAWLQHRFGLALAFPARRACQRLRALGEDPGLGEHPPAPPEPGAPWPAAAGGNKAGPSYAWLCICYPQCPGAASLPTTPWGTPLPTMPWGSPDTPYHYPQCLKHPAFIPPSRGGDQPLSSHPARDVTPNP